MKKFIILLFVCFSFPLSVNAIEYKEMKFYTGSGNTIIRECYYTSDGTLSCKDDNIAESYIPTKCSTFYNQQNRQYYSVIEKGNKTTIYNNVGQEIFSHIK